MSVHPAKTQASMGIRPVWSESSLCAQWVAKDQRFLHVDSEDSYQTGQMPRLIWVFAGRTLISLVLSCRGSNKQSQLFPCLGVTEVLDFAFSWKLTETDCWIEDLKTQLHCHGSDRDSPRIHKSWWILVNPSNVIEEFVMIRHDPWRILVVQEWPTMFWSVQNNCGSATVWGGHGLSVE